METSETIRSSSTVPRTFIQTTESEISGSSESPFTENLTSTLQHSHIKEWRRFEVVILSWTILIPVAYAIYIISTKTSVCQRSECRKQLNSLKLWRSFTLDPCNDFYEYTCNTWNIHKPKTPFRIFLQQQFEQRIMQFQNSRQYHSDSEDIVDVATYLYQHCVFIDNTNVNFIQSVQRMLISHKLRFKDSFDKPSFFKLLQLGNTYDFDFLFTVRKSGKYTEITRAEKPTLMDRIYNFNALRVNSDRISSGYQRILATLNATEYQIEWIVYAEYFILKELDVSYCKPENQRGQMWKFENPYIEYDHEDRAIHLELYNAAVALKIINENESLVFSRCATRIVQILQDLGDLSDVYVKWLAHKYFSLPLFIDEFFDNYDKQVLCIQFFDVYLGAALTASFYWSKMSKNHIANMKYSTHTVLEAIKYAFKSSSWLTAHEKNQFVEKLNQLKIGVPLLDMMETRDGLNRLYSNYSRNMTHFSDLMLNISATFMRDVLREGRQFHVEYLSWLIDQSRYRLGVIRMEPMMAISPLYYSDGVMALNMGFYYDIVVHEIMHAFIYVEHRNPPRISLDAKSKSIYARRSMCHIKAVSPHIADNLSEALLRPSLDDDTRRVAERLVDFIGFQILVDLVKNKYSEETLEGYSPLQLFFIGRCATLCDSFYKEDIFYPSQHDRCNRLLKTNNDFRKEFKCSPKTYMGAAPTCTNFFQ